MAPQDDIEEELQNVKSLYHIFMRFKKNKKNHMLIFVKNR
jgi:hypothetical protein